MWSTILTSKQIYGLIGFGGLYWAAAALAIRSVPEVLFGNQNRQIMTYIAGAPLTYVAMLLTEMVMGLSPSTRVDSVMIMTAFATMIDGTALMWFPHIYENPELMKRNSTLAIILSRRGAAWILWGVGVGFLVAIIT